MAVRGFLSGVIWGGIVSMLGLGVVSQLMPMPGANSPTAPTEKVAAAVPEPVTAPTQPSEPPEPKAPAVLPTATPTAEPVAEEPVPSDATKDPAKTAPSQKPEISAAAPAPAAEGQSQTPEPVEPGAPAENTPPAAAVPTPEPAAPVVVQPVPEVPVPKAASADPASLTAPEGTTPAPNVVAAADPTPKPGEAARPTAPEADQQPAAAELPPVPPLTAEEQAQLDQAQAKATAPAVDAGKVAEPVVPPAPEAETTTEPAKSPAPKAPDVVELMPAPTPEPTTRLVPTPGLTNSADGVTVGRLPTITAEPKPPADAADAEASAVPEAKPDAESGVETNTQPAPSDDQTPLQKFAARFENVDQKPLFAVILIDTGGPNVDRKALAKLPFPVTFAIDPTAPDASTAAAIYREAGQEVVMLATGIPKGATATDLEVTFQSNAAALPEAVAVLDLEEGGFQNDRPLATEVVPVVKGQGRGLVTWDKGLNAGDQVAHRDGIPSATVFRRLDGDNENPSTLRRYLDRAAFKAAQDGRVTVVGQTTPETVAALMEWAVEGRASSVALAPISAVLSKP